MQSAWIVAYHYVANGLDTAKIIMAKQLEFCAKEFPLDTISFTLSKGDRVYDSRLQVADADLKKFGMDKTTLTACQEMSEGTCMLKCSHECAFRSKSNPF